MWQANIQVVKVGEFAWYTMEKESRRFDFSWLDKLKFLKEI